VTQLFGYRLPTPTYWQRETKTHQRVANENKTTTNALAESTFNLQLHQRVPNALSRCYNAACRPLLSSRVRQQPMKR